MMNGLLRKANNCYLASQGRKITPLSQIALSTILVASKAESAVRELKQGEELNTYYNEDFIGENKKLVLSLWTF